MRLSETLSGVPIVSERGDRKSEIQGLALDSRKVRPGALFFALPGAKTDGNRFIRQAVENGAAAVVSELKAPPAPFALTRPEEAGKSVAWIQVADAVGAMGRIAANFYGDPSGKLCVVGVTGTNGKTTTSYLLESIFARAGGAPGVIGTVSHRFKGRVMEPAQNTTPFSADLQRLLARMRDEGGTHAVMEVSSHALAAQRVDQVSFDAAVWTNFASDHLDFHKTREAYFEAKERLFTLLEREVGAKPRRVGVLNYDDEYCMRMTHRSLAVPLATFGLTPQADYAALSPAYTLAGTSFRLVTRGEEYAMRMKLIGAHNLANAAAAAAAALELGIKAEDVAAGLAGLERVPGRLDPVDEGQGFLLLVDYAHTADALASVLSVLRALPHRRLITVFGCGGDRDAGKRGPMGVAACRGADLAIATSDNPRSEDPLSILRQIEEGIRREGLENYRIIPDRAEAIREAVKSAQDGDVVLIAGKGHETGQILGERTVPFDDADTARAALKDLGRI